MRRLKIGIRPQLIILVCFASLFSLLILAVVTGVYFSENLNDLRAERLEVISQLKTTQVSQSLGYLSYQVLWLTTLDQITQPLSQYRAGNNSRDMFIGAQSTLDQFMSSNENFVAVRLYNLDLDVVAASANNATVVSTEATNILFPLQANATLPQSLLNPSGSGLFLTGPVSNGTVNYYDEAYYSQPYFMGITFPVLSNSSIILNKPYISGYLTVLASAKPIQDSLSASSPGATGYTSIAVKPIFDNSSTGAYTTPSNDSSTNRPPVGFETVFPVNNSLLTPGQVYNINDSSSIKTALETTAGSGTATNVVSISNERVAIGFTRFIIDQNTQWVIIIVQSRSVFMEPINRLKRIIIGVVIGIGVFMCLLTFPLAVWFIRPITKLKEATEAITRYKKEKSQFNNQYKNPNNNNDTPTPMSTSINESISEGGATKLSNRTGSITSGSGSVYSTGIRLPERIPRSKKFFKDELTELSEAFNIMTEELDKQYTHLEDRVRSRTKELEASKIEAEAANEAKTVFIANISHELRTPLNGILGMTSIAMDEEDQTRIQDSLKLIHRSGELLLHILTELLTYSKNTLNRSKLEKSNFQILEIVYQVKSIFNKLAQDQRVNFDILIKPNVFRKLILFGDSNRIIQIVMNLVSNSLKFTPVDGSVNVTFKLLGEYDEERSKAENYQHVYILHRGDVPPPPGPRRSRHASTTSNTGIPSTSITATTTTPNEPARETDKGYFRRSKSKHQSDGDRPDLLADQNDDMISIVTLSTAEYENTVFDNQFKPKALPDIPSSSFTPPSSSSEKLPKNIASTSSKDGSIDTIVLEDEKTDISSPGTSEDHSENSNSTNSTPQQEKHKTLDPIQRRDSTPSPILSAQDPLNILAQPQGYPIHEKKIIAPDLPPMAASIEETEIVKDDKVYRIRTMYKPKTWAIQVEVTDTGPGIEPALQEKVFEPFVQGDQTLSRSYGGTGLGLSICRQLATMMNGTLTLKSTIGRGSTFTLTIPLPQTGEIMVPPDEMAYFCEDEFNPHSKMNRKVAFDDKVTDLHTPISEEPPMTTSSSEDGSDTKSSPESPYPPSSPRMERPKFEKSDTKGFNQKPRLYARGSTGTADSGGNRSGNWSGSSGSEHGGNLLDEIIHLKILVAEDNLVNQEVIRRMLKLEGFTNITMACNGAEAIELVKDSIEKEDMYDLIFMDVQMPKVDGLLATRMIRNNLHYDKPIIALTAFADESNVRECLNSGMSGFLSKPIRRTNLRKIIVEFSPVLLSEIVTTPQTHHSNEDKRLGFGSSYIPPMEY
ncbi:SLN1 [[Candida] subhashii]|uniref:histidine kinase n=1 Tax=[Candida] subhashii TaxID=561895 RepID=A0A8J5UKU1_9ASCO|nr:SLN1 [[Candida] subhashii]KAG7662252.1 SLN1 [[Candida] subhashii]